MRQFRTSKQRSGFTLVEMLVVIGILLILAYMSLSIYNAAADSDRIRSSARQIQSYLEGARDRAILSGRRWAEEGRKGPQPSVGVRFLLDQNAGNGGGTVPQINAMVFVESSPPIRGKLDMVSSTEANQTDQEYYGQTLSDLALRGQLYAGLEILVYNPSIADYSDIDDQKPHRLRVSSVSPFVLSDTPTWYNGTPGGQEFIFELQVGPSIMANQEPISLGPNIVIDASESDLPSAWSSTSVYDIMFSPRGVVTGPAAASGLVHFVLRDVADVENGRALSDPNREGDELIVSLFTRTGHISSHPVHPTDKFRFAETGEVAQ